MVIPASIAAYVASFWYYPYVMWCVSIWCVLWAVCIRARGSKIAIRAAAWPGLFSNDMTPTTCSPETLLASIQGVPLVVGSGWGFFLQRMFIPAPHLFMHKFTGPMPGEYRKKPSKMRWAAGTTIRTVVEALKKEHLTFPSHPSLDDITIGAWFATGSHGSGGDAGRSSSSVFKDATVIDLSQRKLFFHVDYSRLRQWCDGQPGRYLVVDVSFKDLVPNDDIQKRGIEIPLDMKQTGYAATEEWLEQGAILRFIFLGAGRATAIGLRWTEPYSATTHRDPHCCSRLCTYLQADICSVVCGYREDMSRWNGKTTLAEANKWVPEVLPFNSLLVVLQGYKNFEIVVDIQLNAETLWDIMHKFKTMHDELGGRTEIRYGVRYLFIDVVMRQGFQTPFIILNEFGIEKIALHPGKWKPDTILVEEITLSEMYGMSTEDMLY